MSQPVADKTDARTRERTAEVRQTNDEGEMIDWLHEAADLETPVVLNPAAWGHYSYALRDACAMLTAPRRETSRPGNSFAASSDAE